MKIDTLLSHVFGFFEHAGRHAEESRKSTAVLREGVPAQSPTLVFRGRRYQPDRTAASAGNSSGADALRIFRGRPVSRSSASRELSVVGRLQAIRVFRGRVVR